MENLHCQLHEIQNHHGYKPLGLQPQKVLTEKRKSTLNGSGVILHAGGSQTELKGESNSIHLSLPFLIADRM